MCSSLKSHLCGQLFCQQLCMLHVADLTGPSDRSSGRACCLLQGVDSRCSMSCTAPAVVQLMHGASLMMLSSQG